MIHWLQSNVAILFLYWLRETHFIFFFNLLIIVLMNIIQEKSLSQNHCLNVFLYWLNETHLILLASILSPSLIVLFHLFFLTCSSLSSLHPFRVCHRGLISSSRLQLSYSLSAHTFNVMIFSSQWFSITKRWPDLFARAFFPNLSRYEAAGGLLQESGSWLWSPVMTGCELYTKCLGKWPLVVRRVQYGPHIDL